MANLFGIQLRTGCMCNMGACQMHLGLSDDMLMKLSAVSIEMLLANFQIIESTNWLSGNSHECQISLKYIFQNRFIID